MRRPKLVPNAQRVLKHSWCLRLVALAAALSGAEAILPLIDYRLPGPAWLRAAVLFTVVGAAFAARLVAQKAVSGR